MIDFASNNSFKRHRESRKERKHDFKPARANSFLIVTEGEKTEPNYFGGLRQKIKEKLGGCIDIEVYGKGCGTKKLIESTKKIIKNSKILYQNVWVVFDKDDFKDFDTAIELRNELENELGKETNVGVAWSNQSFEYWLYLHFNYSDVSLHRKEWNKKLNEIFKQNNLGDGTYHKNYDNIYDLVNINDGVNRAIKNAKKRMKKFDEQNDKPSQFDPGTTVYKLVEELKRYLDE